MALLPFAGWAEDKEVTVTLYDFTIQWGAVEPTVGTLSTDAVKYQATPALTPEELAEVKSFLTFSRVDDGSANWNSHEVGVYSWTLTKAVSTPGYTIYLSSNNAKMTIEKIPTIWTTDPAIAAGVDYDGASHNLLSTLGVSSFGTPKYSIDGGNTWASGMPTASAVATYTVMARVEGDAHHSGIDAAPVAGTMKINGLEVSDIVAPTGAAGLKYTGVAQNLLATPGSATGGTVMYSLDDGANWSADVPQGTDKAAYTIKWKIKGDATHNDKEDAAYTLDVAIAEGTPVITAPTGAAGLTYNKQQQALLATNGSVTLGATLTYDVSFNGGSAENKATADLVVGQNAGTYTITPQVAATANTAAVIGTPFDVVIAQKDLYIYVQDKTKVYDGDAFNLGTAVIEYNGLIAGDALVGAVTASYVDAGSANKGVYAVTTAGGVNTNYNIHRLETGKFTINARPITLTAKPQTIIFGDAVPGFAVNTTYIDIQAAGEGVGLVAGQEATVLGAIQSVGLKETKTDIGTYEGNIIITKKATAAEDAPNYEISVVAGTYKINPAGGYALIAQNKTVTYGEDYEFTYIAPNGEPVKAVAFDVYKGEEKLEANPTDFGTYTIKVRPDTYAPANFGGAEAVITYIDGTLTIEKKALKIAPKAQTLRVGKKATDLVASMVEFTGVVAGDEGKIDYTLAFNVGDGEGQIAAAKFTDGDATKALLDAAAGTYDKGIKAVLSGAAEGNRNANYTLDAVASVGQLKVVNAATLVLGNNEASDLADLSTYNGANVQVRINLAARNGRKLPAATTRNWEKETWVTLTLPFDITVADLSQALGYAIVNVIDPEATVIDGTGSKFYGKLTMKGGNGYHAGEADADTKLAANKPILVKIADDIANVGTDGVVDFGAQTIVAPANEAALTVDAGKGAKFIGTYAAKTVTKDNDAALWFMLGNTPKWAYIGTSSDNSWTIKPFEAYINMSGASNSAPNMTFYFEELDGTVTAITNVSADDLGSAQKANAEGWYTLQGVKLDSAPTQKGIYIYNGKKVAVQ